MSGNKKCVEWRGVIGGAGQGLVMAAAYNNFEPNVTNLRRNCRRRTPALGDARSFATAPLCPQALPLRRIPHSELYSINPTRQLPLYPPPSFPLYSSPSLILSCLPSSFPSPSLQESLSASQDRDPLSPVGVAASPGLDPKDPMQETKKLEESKPFMLSNLNILLLDETRIFNLALQTAGC